MHTHDSHTVKTHALKPCAQLHCESHAVLSLAVLWDHSVRALLLAVKTYACHSPSDMKAGAVWFGAGKDWQRAVCDRHCSAWAGLPDCGLGGAS